MMDPITSILSGRMPEITDKVTFKDGAFGIGSKAVTIENPKLTYDEENGTIVIIGEDDIVTLPDIGVVLWDSKDGKKHALEINFKVIGYLYTKKALFRYTEDIDGQ